MVDFSISCDIMKSQKFRHGVVKMERTRKTIESRITEVEAIKASGKSPEEILATLK